MSFLKSNSLLFVTIEGLFETGGADLNIQIVYKSGEGSFRETESESRPQSIVTIIFDEFLYSFHYGAFHESQIAMKRP